MLKINNPAVENLQAARNLIADPEKWCQGKEQTDDGRVCAVRAVWATGANLNARRALDKAARQLYWHEEAGEPLWPAVRVNDDLGHAAVLRMFDRAIELALNDPHP